MEFVGSVVDFGIAPEIHVDGIARVELISAHVVRVTYYARHKTSAGRIENRIVLYTDWDVDTWKANMALTDQCREEVLSPPLAPKLVSAH